MSRLLHAAAIGALAGVFACICTARAAAQDGIGLPLRAVRLQCDAWIDEDGLRAQLPLVLGEALTPEQIGETRRVLELAKLFRDIVIETSAEDGGAIVTLRLKRKRIVTDVNVRGYDELRWRDVQRLLRLRTGSFYDPEVVEASRQRLITRYQQLGYPQAKVDGSAYTQAGEVDLDFTIDEGTPVRIASIVVSGDSGLPAKDLEYALRKQVGKPHRRESARDGERALLEQLRQAGYYDAQIDGEWIETGNDSGVLWFTVDAGVPSEIEIVGNEARCRKQLLGLMDLNTRLIVTDGTWRELARRMKREYQEAGYYRVDIKLAIDDGEPRRITYTIDEGRKYEVRRVDFAGNKQLKTSKLRDEMNTQPARWLPWPRKGAFVRDVFDGDLRRLWFFYREQGFNDAEIVDAPVEVDDASGAIKITIVVDEGPQTVVDVIRPPDLSGLPEEKQEVKLVPEPGEPLLPAQIDADTQAITRALRSDGYGEATVEPVVTRRNQGLVAPAVVDWKIVRGTRREIGAVIVQGNVETRNEVILDKLPFKPGDPLDPEQLQRGQDRVYQLGAYRSVSVHPLDPPSEDQDVGVEVVPRPPGSIQWGAGYNTRDGITGFGEVSFDNVAHRARRISLRGLGSVIPDDPSQTQFLAVLAYRDPQIFHSRWQWTAELIGERSTKTIDQFSVLRGSVGNGLATDLLPRLKGGAELQVERADTFNVKPQSFLEEDQGISWTVALSPFLVLDGRNDPFAPTSGVFDSLRLRYAPPGLSTVQLGKINMQHSQAFPLARWLSFVYNARVGFGRAFSGGPVLPIRERYFLGGSTTVRGYSENSLGPVDSTPAHNVIGGDLAMVLSFELRVPIIYQLSGAVFNDNGGLFLTQCGKECRQQRGVENNAFTFDNIRQSVGPGLRYMTPVGPISLDYGFKLNRREGESIGEVHFSISGTF